VKIRASKIPAYLALRLITLFLAVIGIASWFSAGKFFSSIAAIQGQHDSALLMGGIILLLVGVAGPVRIIRKGAQLPAEVKQTIIIQAIVLPLVGIVLIFSGMADKPTAVAWGFVLVGLLVLVSAFTGFYALSTKLPRAFYVGELLSVIKSAGLAGDRKDSPADREFMRWTKGVRDGVPVGEDAPDGTVITMEGEAIRLSSFFNEHPPAPLVLNFASYTCPHFRRRIAELHTLMANWQDRGVRFLTIYTAEAHTEDGWKIPRQFENDDEYSNENEFRFYYAKSVDDRRHMVNWLVEKKRFKMRVVLDAPGNELLETYNTWPIRLYIVDDGKIVYCADQGPFGYDPDRAGQALQNLSKEY